MAFGLRCEFVFDGRRLLNDAAVVIEKNRIVAIVPMTDGLPSDIALHDLGDGYLAPGLVDLQINGGAGLMVGKGTSVADLTKICLAHARLGSTSVLPTLISDTPDTTAEVIDAAISAANARVPGMIGLHLEGPHLDPRRAGAHDPALLRPMDKADLALLEHAARHLPVLMLTVAPEAVSAEQIARLVQAGIVISLGHTDCSDAEARVAHAAGAKLVTHLYNAMGPLDKRNPGLVGAALDSDMRAGIIADGIHVSDTALRVAIRAKDPEHLFLVSDAMAFAGSTKTQMKLQGRTIWRRKGALRLDDGTLAGADTTMAQSLAYLISIGIPPSRALSMATRLPAQAVGVDFCGSLAAGRNADLVHLSHKMDVLHVWQRGEVVMA
jgi:N-acetylglucosamine-6-phosphate deacetylase